MVVTLLIGTTAMAPRQIGGTAFLQCTRICAQIGCPTGVVDNTLKVYGLKNVRVVDAGVIPLTVGVATQPTVYALAEKVNIYTCVVASSYSYLAGIGYHSRTMGPR
jgi:hypothetical protein